MKKRGKTKHCQHKSDDFHFYKLENPFKNFSMEEITSKFIEAGDSYEKEFLSSFKKIENLLNEFYPLAILSILSVYNLFRLVTDSNQIVTPRKPTLDQSHIELLQAFCLRIPANKISYKPALPHQIQIINDLLISICDSFAGKRFSLLKDDRFAQNKSMMFLQERIRTHTQRVRNWGYFEQVVDISKRIYEPLNKRYETCIGISAIDIINFFYILIKQSETKICNHWDKLSDVFKEKSIEKIISKYYKLFDLKGDQNELISFCNDNEINLVDYLKSHSDILLVDYFSFRLSEISQEIQIPLESLQRFLPLLSMKFGDLSNEEPEHFFLNNPIWKKPLIQLTKDKFFCSMPQVFFGFVIQILDSLLEEKENSKEYCSTRKSIFLEEEVENIFKVAFPGSPYVRNFKWKENDIEYETDLIIKVDSYLIVVESKSGSISLSALRGAPKSIERNINELLIYPSIQSYRLEKRILQSKDSSLFNLPFDISSIQKVIRISITLEDFAMIQSNINQLKRDGIINNEFPVSPTILLSDIKIVFDILISEMERLHYLVRRKEIDENMTYFADELDLLGIYLSTGFNIGEIEQNKKAVFNFIGNSTIIDDYYLSVEQGISKEKPKLKLTKWWREIIKFVEKRKPNRWSEIAEILLNISFDDQKKGEKEFKRYIRNVQKNWEIPGHKNSLFICPQKYCFNAIGLIAYKELSKNERFNLIENSVNSIFKKCHAKRCLIIGKNVDSNDYPYSIL
ncbi:MAG: hypothetical protein AB1656_12270, partial [Candidatus Omnitrophota bacterium]